MSDFNSKTHRVVRKVNAYSAHATFQQEKSQVNRPTLLFCSVVKTACLEAVTLHVIQKVTACVRNQ